MYSLPDGALNLALDKLAQIDAGRVTDDYKGLVNLMVELGPDVLSRECHGLSEALRPKKNGHDRLGELRFFGLRGVVSCVHAKLSVCNRLQLVRAAFWDEIGPLRNGGAANTEGLSNFAHGSWLTKKCDYLVFEHRPDCNQSSFFKATTVNH